MMNTACPNECVYRRVQDLDTIAAVLLPMERRDELAELLTDQDVEYAALRHLVNEGMGDNTLRALTSDLAYLQAWSLAATGRSLPWSGIRSPASEVCCAPSLGCGKTYSGSGSRHAS